MIVRRTAAAFCLALSLAAPAAAEEEQAGAWLLRWETSGGRESLVIATTLAPEATGAEPTYLTIRCVSGRTEFFAGTAGDWGLPRRPFRVSWRVRDGLAGDEAWDVSTNGKAAFFGGDAPALLKRLPENGTLTITVASPSGAEFATAFPLAGIAQVRKRAGAACGWEP
jgi:hypothetical protein